VAPPKRMTRRTAFPNLLVREEVHQGRERASVHEKVRDEKRSIITRLRLPSRRKVAIEHPPSLRKGSLKWGCLLWLGGEMHQRYLFSELTGLRKSHRSSAREVPARVRTRK